MKIITWMLASAIGIGVLGQATPTEANLLKQLRKNFLRGNGDGGDAAAAAIEAQDRLLQEATSSMSMMISDIDNIALPSLLSTDEITELVDDMKAEDIDISLSTAMTIMASSSDNLPAYHHGDSFCEWFVNKMTYHLPLPHTHKHVEDGTGGKNCPYLMGKLCDVKPTPKPSTPTGLPTLKPMDNPSSSSKSVGETCTEDSDCCGETCFIKGLICYDKTRSYNTIFPILDCTKTCTRFEDCAGLGIDPANIGCGEFKNIFCTTCLFKEEDCSDG